MAWWNATSVTISNNQNVVVVNAADNIGLINDGDALVLAGQIVEIDRAYFDNNNAPRILLKSNWTSGNQTNQPAKAVPIPADLRRAVQYLRDVGQDAITFSEAMAQILSSTAATLVIPTATSGDVTVVPYGRLAQQVNALLATMGDFGVPLYDTDTKNQARTLLGLQPQITAQPTLDLDFVNNDLRVYEPFGLTRKTLTEAITTARNSVANYSSPFGIAQAAVNTPRIEFNPATGECLGLLCEEQRTNLGLWSEDLTQSNHLKIRTIATATKVIEDSTPNNNHYIYEAINFVSGQTYCKWFVVSAAGRSNLAIEFSSFGGAFASSVARFDLAAGTSLNVSCNDAGIVYLGNDEYLIYAVETAVASAPGRILLYLAVGVSSSGTIYNGDGTSGVNVLRQQLEVGSFPTSYIKTEGSQVTRAGDRVIAPTSAPTSGTAFFEGVFRSGMSTGFSGLLNHVNGANYFGLNVPSNSQRIRLQTVPPTSTNIETGNIPFGSKFKAAYRWTPSQLTLAVNGVIIGTQTHTGLITPNVIGVRVLGESAFAINRDICTALGEIPRALSDQELIDLTRL